VSELSRCWLAGIATVATSLVVSEKLNGRGTANVVQDCTDKLTYLERLEAVSATYTTKLHSPFEVVLEPLTAAVSAMSSASATSR